MGPVDIPSLNRLADDMERRAFIGPTPTQAVRRNQRSTKSEDPLHTPGRVITLRGATKTVGHSNPLCHPEECQKITVRHTAASTWPLNG